jgi:hypothetical protein
LCGERGTDINVTVISVPYEGVITQVKFSI